MPVILRRLANRGTTGKLRWYLKDGLIYENRYWVQI
ncbi:hypothetical protein CBM2599_A10275 [Cupriavidus taiwanensis]|nr:hypothetical protein CBM2599_A10275 [Cupriavidus taiwanensis]SOY80461.1 hypothetical protein CBM2600_A10118 [Cupriavidus taiwanensis]